MADRKIGVALTADVSGLQKGLSAGSSAASQFAAETEAAMSRAVSAGGKLSAASQYVAKSVDAVALSSQAHSAAAERFVRDLERQAAVLGKTRTEVLSLQAANLGVSAQAAPIIQRMEQQEAAQEAAARAAREEAAAQREAMRAKQQAESSQQAFLSALREQAETVGMNSQQLLEYRAAQLGISKQAAPLIAQLGAGTTSISEMGMSAAQTANAMRMVPAQMTDIIVSLQSGQAPMTVLLQQGGQLKDMFGGIGPAAKALGGYVMGMVNPFTIAAAAAGAMFLAFRTGASEHEAFSRTLLETGNTVGLTAGQLQDTAKRLDDVIGTQRRASAALNEFVKSGAAGSESLESFAASAIRWEDATGAAIEDTAKQFEELGKAPLEASIKLNESMGHLTVSIYEQIKALVDQGRETEAATVAQKAFADAMDTRAPQIVSQAGAMERAWRGVKNAVAEAIDAIAGVGRAETAGDAIREQTVTVGALQKELDGYIERGRAVPSRLRAQLDAARELLTEMQREYAQTTTAAGAAKREQEALARSMAVDTYLGDSSRVSRAKQMQKDLDAERAAYAEAVKNAQGNSEKLQAIENAHGVAMAGIREKYKDKGGSGGVSASDTELANLRARIEDEKQLAAQLAATGGVVSKLNEGERLSLQYAEKLKLATDAKTKASLTHLKAKADELAVLQRENKAGMDMAEQREKEAEAQAKEIDSINEKARKLEDEIAVYGMGKAAIESLAIARLESRRAALIEMGASGELIESIEREIAARERLAKGVAQKEVLDANKKASEEAARDWERMTGQVEQALTDALFNGGKSGKELIEDLFRTMILRPTLQPIVQGGMNALGRALGIPGAEGASGGGLVGTAQQGLSLYNNASNAWNTISSLWGGSAAAGLSTGFGTAAAGLGLGWGAMGTGAAAMTGAGLGTASAAAGLGLTGSALGTGMGAATGAGLGLSAGGATLGGVAGTSAAAGAGAGSIMGAIGAAAPYAAIAFAAYQVISSMMSEPEARFGGTYQYRPGQGTERPGWAAGDLGPQAMQFADGLLSSAGDAIQRAFAGAGSDALLSSLEASFESSEKGRGGTHSGGVLVIDGHEIRFGTSAKGQGHGGTNGTVEEMMRNAEVDAWQTVIQAWQSAIDQFPKMMQDMLLGVDADALGLDAAQALAQQFVAVIEQTNAFAAALGAVASVPAAAATFDFAAALGKAAGGVDNATSLFSSFYQNFFTEAERIADLTASVTEHLAGLGFEMPRTRDEFRALVQANMAMGEAGAQTVAALLAVESQFVTLSAASEAVANERMGLERQLLQLQGNTTELRRLELEALDPSNRALQQRIWALQNEQAAIDRVTQVAADLVQSTWDAAVGGVNNAMAAITQAVEAERSSAQAAYQSSMSRYQASMQTAQQAVSELSSVSSSLSGALRSMRLESDAFERMRREQAQAQITSALAIARAGGSLRGMDLSDALSEVSRSSTMYFSTFEDYAADWARTANEVSELQGIADVQLSAQERTVDRLERSMEQATRQHDAAMAAYEKMLAEAQAQVDASLGIDTSVMTVQQAIMALAQSISVLDNAKRPPIATPDTATSVVDVWYRDVLGRPADSAGASYWESQISKLGASKALQDFLWSARSAGELASFDVGTNYVPHDMVAKIHQGERIIPAADNARLMDWITSPAQSNAVLVAEIQRLGDKMDRAERRLAAIESNTRDQRDLLDEVSEGGNGVRTVLIENITAGA